MEGKDAWCVVRCCSVKICESVGGGGGGGGRRRGAAAAVEIMEGLVCWIDDEMEEMKGDDEI